MRAAPSSWRNTLARRQRTALRTTGRRNTGRLKSKICERGHFPRRGSPVPGASVLKENRSFTVYDVVLKARSPEVMHNHTGATIIVLLAGTLEQGGIGGPAPLR